MLWRDLFLQAECVTRTVQLSNFDVPEESDSLATLKEEPMSNKDTNEDIKNQKSIKGLHIG